MARSSRSALRARQLHAHAGYLLDAKDRYQGPIRTLEEDVVTRD
jgi:hypothetical protein